MKEVTLFLTTEITKVFKGEVAEQINERPEKTLMPKLEKRMKEMLGVDDLKVIKSKVFINEEAGDEEN